MTAPIAPSRKPFAPSAATPAPAAPSGLSLANETTVSNESARPGSMFASFVTAPMSSGRLNACSSFVIATATCRSADSISDAACFWRSAPESWLRPA